MRSQRASFNIEQQPLGHVVSVPPVYSPETDLWPVLCFLHGSGEAAPLDIRQAVKRHGPLRSGSSRKAANQFIVVIPQLPAPGGDVWYRHARAVREIVTAVQTKCGGNPGQTYLTGFSYGADGVFDIAPAQQGFWSAIWPVDPTRVPKGNPECPVWLSSGPAARKVQARLNKVLRLQPVANNWNGDFVYEDRGLSHVDTATFAYQDSQVYDWLLARHL
jgi:predicted peptidase